MMRNKFYILGLVIVLVFLNCSSVRVTVNYDEAAVFSSYRTFYFVRPKQQPRPGGAVRNPIFTKEVMREMGPILESKGFAEARTREEADLLVVFYAAVQNRRDFVPPTYRVGRFGRVWRARPGRFVNYREGTLVVDIVDRRKQELIWQGVGRGVLDRVNPMKNLVGSVEEVLKEFPPEE